VATIKTQGGLVLVKNGRISCSCCGVADCCMYPAEYYGSLFDFEDLPDVLIDPIGGLPYPKLSEPTLLPFVSPEDPYIALYGDVDPSQSQSSGYSYGILASQPDRWAAHVDAGAAPAGSCLVYDPNLFGDGPFDDFADSYTGQFYGGIEQTPIGPTWTVSRASLCVWEGVANYGNFTAPARLEYLGTRLDTTFVGWAYNGIPTKGITPAGGPTAQNNPEGIYPTEDGDIVVEFTSAA